MTSVPRRSLRALVVCAIALATPAFTVSGPTPAANCETLIKWARMQYANRPPTLAQLATFDRPHRLAIFTAIAPEARAALWRAQLTEFSARAELTNAQRAFVEEVLSATTPAIYAEDSATRHERGRHYAGRAAQLFPARAQLAAFYDLGSTAIAAQPAPSLIERLSPSFVAAAQYPYCQCSIESPWQECGGVPCVGAACQGWNGCGWEGWYGCNGNCAGR